MPAALFAIKTVVRCAEFAKSYDFYTRVLGLAAESRWEEPQGKGCVFALAAGGCGCLLEIYQMNPEDSRFSYDFTQPLASDKIDLQLRTDSVDAWADALRGIWPFDGPEDLPWGQRWIRLRDPDNLLIAIYQDPPL